MSQMQAVLRVGRRVQGQGRRLPAPQKSFGRGKAPAGGEAGHGAGHHPAERGPVQHAQVRQAGRQVRQAFLRPQPQSRRFRGRQGL